MHAVRQTLASLAGAARSSRFSSGVSLQISQRWLSHTSRRPWPAGPPQLLTPKLMHAAFGRQLSTTSETETAKVQDNSTYPEAAVLEEFSELPEALKRVLSLENASQRERNQFEKRQAMKQYQLHPTDTGSPEAQIAMLTVRINRGNDHVRTARKDNSSKRALMRFVEARKRHLRYLKRESEERYFALIEKIGLNDTINLVPPRAFLPAEAQRAALQKQLRKKQERQRVADEKAATVARGAQLRERHRQRMELQGAQDEAHEKSRQAAQEAVDSAAAEEGVEEASKGK